MSPQKRGPKEKKKVKYLYDKFARLFKFLLFNNERHKVWQPLTNLERLRIIK